MGSERELNREFFLAQRDKHLEQFMAINGRAAFAAITAIVGLILGANKLREFCLAPWKWWIFFVLLVAGIFLLFAGVYFFACFHVKKIRKFEKLSAKCEGQMQRDLEHYQIIPTAAVKNPLTGVLVGIALCVLAALWVMFWVAM